jgi:hypothetical protein
MSIAQNFAGAIGIAFLFAVVGLVRALIKSWKKKPPVSPTAAGGGEKEAGRWKVPAPGTAKEVAPPRAPYQAPSAWPPK